MKVFETTRRLDVGTGFGVPFPKCGLEQVQGSANVSMLVVDYAHDKVGVSVVGLTRDRPGADAMRFLISFCREQLPRQMQWLKRLPHSFRFAVCSRVLHRVSMLACRS